MERSNTVKSALFLFFIVLVIVGGFIFMQYMTKEEVKKPKKDKEVEVVLEDIRLDKSKDYIYYIDDKYLIKSEDIGYQNIIFNLDSLSYLNDTLKKENELLLNSIKYTKDMKLDNKKEYKNNEEGIYSLDYREYDNNTFKEYVSVIIKDYYYDIENGIKATNLKSYVFDKYKGTLYTEEELYKLYNTDYEKIKELVKKKLSDTQILVGSENTINVTDTMNNIDKHALSISKTGKLKVTFIVNSAKNIYNDSIEID